MEAVCCLDQKLKSPHLLLLSKCQNVCNKKPRTAQAHLWEHCGATRSPRASALCSETISLARAALNFVKVCANCYGNCLHAINLQPQRAIKYGNACHTGYNKSQKWLKTLFSHLKTHSPCTVSPKGPIVLVILPLLIQNPMVLQGMGQGKDMRHSRGGDKSNKGEIMQIRWEVLRHAEMAA